MDPVHTEWLHAYMTHYIEERAGVPPEQRRSLQSHAKIGFDVFEYGIIKRRVLQGGSEEDDLWKVGHPILFPHILRVGSAQRATLQFRVPKDDSHTYHVSLYAFRAAPGTHVPEQKVVPY